MAASLLPLGVSLVGYFFKQRWARFMLLSLAFPVLISTWGMGTLENVLAVVLAPAILVPVIRSPRARMFFELPVTQTQVHQVWHLTVDNPAARYGPNVAVLPLLVWPLGPIAVLLSIAVPLSIAGLLNVDPTTVPPTGIG